MSRALDIAAKWETASPNKGAILISPLGQRLAALGAHPQLGFAPRVLVVSGRLPVIGLAAAALVAALAASAFGALALAPPPLPLPHRRRVRVAPGTAPAPIIDEAATQIFGAAATAASDWGIKAASGVHSSAMIAVQRAWSLAMSSS